MIFGYKQKKKKGAFTMHMTNTRRNKVMGLLFISIPTLLIILFYFYPMVRSFLLSMQSGMGVNLNWVGIANYRRLLADPVFKQAFSNTLIFLIFQVPIMVILAMFFAVLLNQKTIKLRGLFRTIVYLPSVTSLVHQ